MERLTRHERIVSEFVHRTMREPSLINALRTLAYTKRTSDMYQKVGAAREIINQLKEIEDSLRQVLPMDFRQ